ncbi:MAG: hypothetical protein NTX50_10650 [Candidatus Sumerlaeota bacterium]|nr:hypothetical protein [Candidatus Sumerlaeota bacterium]
MKKNRIILIWGLALALILLGKAPVADPSRLTADKQDDTASEANVAMNIAGVEEIYGAWRGHIYSANGSWGMDMSHDFILEAKKKATSFRVIAGDVWMGLFFKWVGYGRYSYSPRTKVFKMTFYCTERYNGYQIWTRYKKPRVAATYVGKYDGSTMKGKVILTGIIESKRRKFNWDASR